MSAPIRGPHQPDDPLLYAPRKARRLPPPALESYSFTPAPPTAPQFDDPGTPVPLRRSRAFEGDIGIKDLRRRLALDPDIAPQPPVRERRSAAARWVGGLSFASILASIAAFGTVLMTSFDTADMARAVSPLREGLLSVGKSARPARLVVKNQSGFANEPIPLGISLDVAPGKEMLALSGLAAGTRLSAGMPLGLSRWRLSASDVGNAFAHSPPDFVGVMDVAVDLHSAADLLLDSQVVRLQWVARKEGRSERRGDSPDPPPAIQRLDADTVAALERFMAHGDLLSARLLLKRAALGGNAQAALELGMTFDPIVLEAKDIHGLASVSDARAWYERALALGSPEASLRLERLAWIKE